MIWMPLRVQPRLLWTTVFSGMLIANGQLLANGPGEPAGNGTVTGNGSGVAVAAAAPAAAGGGRAAVAERGGSPAEGRSFQTAAAAAPRVARVESGGNERVAAVNPPAFRGTETPANGTAPKRYVLRSGNAWTDPLAPGQRQRYYGSSQSHQNTNHQNDGRRRVRSYLYQYYAGYYPVYVDVPIITEYFDGGATINSGYGDAPAVAQDNGDGAAPVIPPSTITVSPPDDSTQATTDAAGASPNGAPGANTSPNPAIGPDSLVEAVQTELAKRGYFQGKVDSMFRPDTEAAVRRFQEDNYLAPTGHLNEPTLHALSLD